MGEKQVRLFFAIMLPDEAQNAVAQVQEELRGTMGTNGIRWTAPEQWHYTLKFLGEVEDTLLPDLVAAGQSVAARVASFLVEIGGTGVFPEKRSPQVLWLGASSGVPLLTTLAEYLNQALVPHGFEPETKFKPHLTLARMKTREGETAVAKNLNMIEKKRENSIPVAAIPVDKFVLVRSELKRGGSVYTTLETFSLSSS